MSKLILITGDLATGKSTLADNLSRFLNIPSFKKDEIKERYCDQYGYKTREENRQLSIMAINFMIETFKRFASSGHDIILEANFRGYEMQEIKEIAEKNQISVTCIVLRGQIDVLYDRFLKRLANRHPAHISLGLDRDISYFKAYLEEQRKEQIPFIPIIIETTNKSADEVLKIALSKIA